MYLKDKFHNMKMREIDSVTRHVHLFCANLNQFVVTRVVMPNDETII